MSDIEYASTFLQERFGDKARLAIVLGSGWSDAVELFGKTLDEVSYANIPGFNTSNIQGHAHKARLVELANGHHLIAFIGRTHLYEGFGVDAVVFGVKVLAKLGVKTLILTNACGGLNPNWKPGTPVLISDHINFTGTTPLRGAHFLDVTEVYSKRLRNICKNIKPDLDEGVYVGFMGPAYETPAEIEMVRHWGGSLVGMSTVLEAMAAREADMEVLGVSLVTNFAAGMSGTPLSHSEVIEAGKNATITMGTLLADVMKEITDEP
ncbi:MAG: purine-nucleoside phosphorylase [Candidatus Nanopelagicales bacterium]